LDTLEDWALFVGDAVTALLVKSSLNAGDEAQLPRLEQARPKGNSAQTPQPAIAVLARVGEDGTL
jgi:hypothetical protein